MDDSFVYFISTLFHGSHFNLRVFRDCKKNWEIKELASKTPREI